METTDYHILETVALNLRPVLDLVRGDILRITGHIVRGIGVRTFCTDGSHQLVILIGDEVLGSHLRDGVDLVVSLLTSLRISQFAIGLITLFDLIEQGFLSRIVVRTKLLGTLEHQVLQIMRQTSGLCRIILRSRSYCNIRLNTGFLLIHAQIHLQPIIQGIDARLHHISWHNFILIILRLRTHSEHRQP